MRHNDVVTLPTSDTTVPELRREFDGGHDEKDNNKNRLHGARITEPTIRIHNALNRKINLIKFLARKLKVNKTHLAT